MPSAADRWAQKMRSPKTKKRIERYRRGLERYGKDDKRGLASYMRNHATPGEMAVRAILMQRNRAYPRGYSYPRWRFQAVIRGFIADNYCPKLGLVIEVDGAAHAKPDKVAADARRDAILLEAGIRTVRFAWPFTDKPRRLIHALLGPVQLDRSFQPDEALQDWQRRHLRDIRGS